MHVRKEFIAEQTSELIRRVEEITFRPLEGKTWRVFGLNKTSRTCLYLTPCIDVWNGEPMSEYRTLVVPPEILLEDANRKDLDIRQFSQLEHNPKVISWSE